MLIFIVFVTIGITFSITVALVPVLHQVIDQQRAQAAADAAALAGVGGGRKSADEIAVANGAVVVAFEVVDGVVIVEVRVGQRVVGARATDEP